MPSVAPHVVVLALELFAFGVLASFLGSVVGLGGGFLAIPVLRLVFHLSPPLAAGTSLFLVTANVASASVSFLRQGRVDLRLGVAMGLLGIPGSIGGAIVLQHFSPKGFDILYALLLGVFALDLLWRGTPTARGGALPKLPWAKRREFYDRLSDTTYVYADSPVLVAAAGLATGFLSSFFGIGGGVLVVPLLLRVFLLPAHIVSATSHFVILLSSPFGLVTHALNGNIYWLFALPLAAGGIVGAQFGAHTARRLSTPALVRTLAVVLIVAAASLIVQHVV